MEMPDDLTESEKYLIAQVAKGLIADFTTDDAEMDRPANAANWGQERTIRASIIRELCIGYRKIPPVDPNGIMTKGARIVGSLDLKFANIPFPLVIIACYVEQTISLFGADIRTLILSGSQLMGGLQADGLKVLGAVFLREGFAALGEVRMAAATVGGQLDCSGGYFMNSDGAAFIGDTCTVKGNVIFTKNFTAKGEVRLNGADIGGQLDCGGGHFEKPDGIALFADGLTVKDSVFLRDGFTAEGEVRMPGANIGGQFSCIRGRFVNPKGIALILQNSNVAARVIFDKDTTFQGELNLADATIGQLVDDRESWPKEGNLYLDGLEYGSFAGTSPTDAKSRLKWLSLQPTNNKDYGFRPQPYEQLVKVLRAMGHERDARIIAIAKQKEMRKTLGPLARAWSWILRISTGYGYETWRAFIGMALMVAIGTVVFCLADGNGDMLATNDSAHVPIFNAFIYSVDTFLPIVDLHQEAYWLPKSEFYKWYLWFHISVGWILTTIAVAAFTGIFKNE